MVVDVVVWCVWFEENYECGNGVWLLSVCGSSMGVGYEDVV